MGRRVQRWVEGYRALGREGQPLFWIIGVVAFAVSLTIIVLAGRTVDLTLLTVTLAQVLSATVIGILASLLFLYLRAGTETPPVSQAPSANLRDLLYFDFDKATSIFSQIEGGLLTEKQVSAEGTREQRQLARISLQVIQPEFGTVSSERTSVLESKVLHHDLLTRLEKKLEEMGLLLDINKAVESEEPDYSDEGLHDLVSRPSFIVAEGWATIEDYNRFDFIADNFKELAGFINRWTQR